MAPRHTSMRGEAVDMDRLRNVNGDRPAVGNAQVNARGDRLGPGGVLLIREVNPNGGFVSQWNRWYEKLATQIGFTQAKKQALSFRARGDWEETIQSAGFQVSSEPCSSIIFADILYIARKPHQELKNADL